MCHCWILLLYFEFMSLPEHTYHDTGILKEESSSMNDGHVNFLNDLNLNITLSKLHYLYMQSIHAEEARRKLYISSF